MRIVIVPDWIVNPLRLVGTNYAALNDPAWLTTLSKRDVAFYDYLHDSALDLLPEAFKRSFEVTIDFQSSIKQSTAGEMDWETHYRFKSEFRNQYGDSPDVHKFSLLCENVQDQNKTFKASENELGFDVLHENDDVFYLRLKPVSYVGMVQCYDQVFSVLTRKCSMEKIVAMPMFSDYEARLPAVCSMSVVPRVA